MKAITITKENQQMLLIRYGFPDVEEFPIGYILLADFGENEKPIFRGVLTQADFDSKYIKGEAIFNGFYSVEKR